MDPCKPQLNQADDQYTAGPGSDTDMHVMYVLHSNQRSKREKYVIRLIIQREGKKR